ncbi:DUF2017 domain-containing protein [Propioniciclava soli]|uniref:DUF2017 domain-containing protein n=1 Tax=Propioniciclava soli TaxID=2775081 RepID=A0ABZ3C4R6_9ACTN
MIGFRREGDALVAEFEEVEVALVSSLVAQVDELLGGGQVGVAPGPSEDPFDAWAGEFGDGVALDDADPVIARLFPDPYPDDPVASAEHKRYTRDALRRGRVDDAQHVLADLDATQGGEHPLVVDVAHAEAWIKTLNGVRLSLAVRLGIESDADHRGLERMSPRDPRYQVVAIYDWLAVVLESLLESL